MRLVILLFSAMFAFGQSSSPLPEPRAESAASPEQKPQKGDVGLGTGLPGRQLGALDILSDTQGVDFGPYLQRILEDIRENWYHLIPVYAGMKKGKLAIECAITKDGKLADMRLVATSGDVTLDRAAWRGITTSNPFPRLPIDFTGPYLALRFRFYYNPDKSDLDPSPSKSGIAVNISPPSDLKVPAGESKAVTARVTGTKEKALSWSITGSGCSGGACGKMEKDSYLAPSVPPSPPFVTLTAISKADPTARASITIHIVQAPVLKYRDSTH